MRFMAMRVWMQISDVLKTFSHTAKLDYLYLVIQLALVSAVKPLNEFKLGPEFVASFCALGTSPVSNG